VDFFYTRSQHPVIFCAHKPEGNRRARCARNTRFEGTIGETLQIIIIEQQQPSAKAKASPTSRLETELGQLELALQLKFSIRAMG
jgi:hypothetical protein